jgi:hypothetical protein
LVGIPNDEIYPGRNPPGIWHHPLCIPSPSAKAL